MWSLLPWHTSESDRNNEVRRHPICIMDIMCCYHNSNTTNHPTKTPYLKYKDVETQQVPSVCQIVEISAEWTADNDDSLKLRWERFPNERCRDIGAITRPYHQAIMIFLLEPRYLSLGAGRRRSARSVEARGAPAARDQRNHKPCPRVFSSCLSQSPAWGRSWPDPCGEPSTSTCSS